MLDNSPLSNMSFANIFSCSVAFLLILLAVILKAKVFNFYEMQLIDSFLYESCFLSFLFYINKQTLLLLSSMASTVLTLRFLVQKSFSF